MAVPDAVIVTEPPAHKVFELAVIVPVGKGIIVCVTVTLVEHAFINPVTV